jgi:hypothetical protein
MPQAHLPRSKSQHKVSRSQQTNMNTGGLAWTPIPPLTSANARSNRAMTDSEKRLQIPHNPEVAGSNPAPATDESAGQRPDHRSWWSASWLPVASSKQTLPPDVRGQPQIRVEHGARAGASWVMRRQFGVAEYRWAPSRRVSSRSKAQPWAVGTHSGIGPWCRQTVPRSTSCERFRRWWDPDPSMES